MGSLTISIAGRDHHVACRDGEEAELSAAAALLDEQATLVAAMGPASDARTLLLAGLLLADRLREERTGRGSPQTDPDREERLARLAERAEALADRLESGAA